MAASPQLDDEFDSSAAAGTENVYEQLHRSF